MTNPEPDTDAIRAAHQHRSYNNDVDVDFCGNCGDEWPCEAVTLSDALDATRQKRDQAEAAVERVRALCDFWDSDLDFIPAKRVRAALGARSLP